MRPPGAHADEAVFIVSMQIAEELAGAWLVSSRASDPERGVERDGPKWGQAHRLRSVPFRVTVK